MSLSIIGGLGLTLAPNENATISVSVLLPETITKTVWSVSPSSTSRFTVTSVSESNTLAKYKVTALDVSDSSTESFTVSATVTYVDRDGKSTTETFSSICSFNIDVAEVALPTDVIKKITFVPSATTVTNIDDKIINVTIQTEQDIVNTVWNVRYSGNTANNNNLNTTTSSAITSASSTEVKWQITESKPTTAKIKLYGSNITKDSTGKFIVYANSTYNYNGEQYSFSANSAFTYTTKKVTPISNSISFSPSSLSFSAGTTADVIATLSSNKTIDSVSWSLKDTSINGVTLSFEEDRNNFSKITLTLDATDITDATTGTAELVANIIYTDELGDKKNVIEEFEYSYTVVKKKEIIDSTPVLTFSPRTISLTNPATGSIYTTVSMERENITNTSWSVSLPSSSKVGYSFTNKNATNSTLKLTTENVVEDETGSIKIFADVTYDREDGTSRTQSVSGRVYYDAFKPLQPAPTGSVLSSIEFNPLMLELDNLTNTSGILHTSYTSEYTIDSCTWSATTVGDKKIKLEFIEKNKYDSRLKVTTDNVTETEIGVIRFSLNVVYLLNGNYEEAVETFDYAYKVTVSPPNDVEGNIIKNVVFSSDYIEVNGGETADITATLNTNFVLDDNTVWKIENTGQTQCTWEIISKSKNQATVRLYTDNVTQTEIGFLYFDITANCTVSGFPFSQQTRKGVQYKVIKEAPTGVTENMITRVVFVPDNINLQQKQTGEVQALIESPYELYGTSWKVENTGTTKMTWDFANTTDKSSVLNINTDNVDIDEQGYLKYTITTNCEVSGYPFTTTKSFNYPYKVTADSALTGSLITSFVLTPNNLEVGKGQTGLITANITSDYELTHTDWEIVKINNTNLNWEIYEKDKLYSKVQIFTNDITQTEQGSLKFVATAKYVYNNKTYTQTQTVELPYKITVSGETSGITITANPSTLVLGDETKVLVINSNTDVIGGWEYVENSHLDIELNSESSLRQGLFTVSPKKVEDETQRTTITIRANWNEDKSNYMDINVPVVIRGNGIYPVWQDNYIYFDNQLGNRIEYKIVDIVNNSTIYSGRVNKLPNGNTIAVNVNRIVDNHLSNHFPSELSNDLTITDLTGYTKTFDILVGGEVYDTLTMYNSWGYSQLPYNNVISDPIRKVIDRKQIFLCSVFSPTPTSKSVRYQLKKRNNITTRATVTASSDKQVLIADWNLKNQPYNQIVVDGIVYDIVDSCKEFCLYYSNAYGGWDSLLIDGNVKRTDNITSYYYMKNYDNNSYQFEKNKYLNVITPTYVLHTDWFTDDEQSRLHHLLESTEVYLHNLKTNEILPVNITNTSCEYKTYKNNGKKKFNNVINVEIAQQRIRK